MIYILIPTTKERKERLAFCLEAVYKSKCKEPFTVCVYENSDGGWVKALWKMIEGINGLIFNIGDDVIIGPECIQKLFDSYKDGFLLQPYDQIQQGKICTNPFCHSDIIKEFLYDGYVHNFADTEMTERIKKLGRYLYVPEAITHHYHFTENKDLMDNTYKASQKYFKQDSELFDQRNICKISDMKIYDCFTFYNELDILEMRLNILDSDVDYFVLVEATTTYSGKEKKLIYDENKFRFKKFENKIIHIIVRDMPEVTKENRWELESFQRNAIMRGLTKCSPDDVIMISDVDEIPNPVEIRKAKNIIKNYQRTLLDNIQSIIGKFATKLNIKNINRLIRKIDSMRFSNLIVFRQKFFYYYLNGFMDNDWLGTRVTSYSNLVIYFYSSPQKMRNGISKNILSNGGWHFSFLLDPEGISLKIKSFAHSEYDKEQYTDPEIIKKKIQNGEDLFSNQNKVKYIKIDNSYPNYILENSERYSKFFRDVTK